jgi:hypothetical protein
VVGARGQKTPEPKVIETERVVIRRPDGRVAVELGLIDGKAQLVIYDEKGKSAVQLGQYDDGYRLLMGAGESRAELSISDKDSTLRLFNKDKKLEFGVGESGSTIRFP